MSFALLMTLAGFYVYQTPVSAVSIDSDSAIEIRLNRFNRVVEIQGFDERGNRIAADLQVKHMGFAKAVEEILRVTDSDTENIYVTIASKHKGQSAQMMADLDAQKLTMKQLVTFQSEANMMDEAKEQGVTVGRMRAMHELSQFDEDASIEEMMDNSTEELIEAAESHRREINHRQK